MVQTERRGDWPGMHSNCQRVVATPAAIWHSSASSPSGHRRTVSQPSWRRSLSQHSNSAT
eukprot:5812259-Pyramimonas_sp.AAC.1